MKILQVGSYSILATWLFSIQPVSGQVTEGEKHLRNLELAGDSGWKTENNLTIAFSQVSLTNWAAGGQNSMSVNGRFNGFFNYKKTTLPGTTRLTWDTAF
jgi:hypothetical protein